MEIAEDIRQRIREGHVDEDGRVGTFGSLQKDYGAAKGTIDKALGELRQEGTVVTVAGKGIYAAGTPALGDGESSLRDRVTELEAQVADLREAHAVLEATVLSLRNSLERPNLQDQRRRRREEAG